MSKEGSILRPGRRPRRARDWVDNLICMCGFIIELLPFFRKSNSGPQYVSQWSTFTQCDGGHNDSAGVRQQLLNPLIISLISISVHYPQMLIISLTLIIFGGVRTTRTARRFRIAPGVGSAAKGRLHHQDTGLGCIPRRIPDYQAYGVGGIATGYSSAYTTIIPRPPVACLAQPRSSCNHDLWTSLHISADL